MKHATKKLADISTKPAQHVQAVIDAQNKGKTKRLNVNVDPVFYKQIKQAAIDDDLSISDLVTGVLSNYLRTRLSNSATE